MGRTIPVSGIGDMIGAAARGEVDATGRGVAARGGIAARRIGAIFGHVLFHQPGRKADPAVGAGRDAGMGRHPAGEGLVLYKQANFIEDAQGGVMHRGHIVLTEEGGMTGERRVVGAFIFSFIDPITPREKSRG